MSTTVKVNAFGAIRDHWVQGVRSLGRGSEHRYRSIAIFTLWMVGLWGDAITTILAMRSGIAHEANPQSNFFFSVFTMEGWMAVSIIVLGVLSVMTLSRPRHAFLKSFVYGLPILLVVKLWVTAHNMAVLFIGMHA